MATESVKAIAVTNADAVPRVPNSSDTDVGRIVQCVGVVPVSASGSADLGSVYRAIPRIPSSARIARIAIAHSALTTFAADLGVYAQNGGAVLTVPASPLIASSQQSLLLAANLFTTAKASPVDVTLAVTTARYAEKRLWELMGFTADPQRHYNLVWTATASNAGSAGYIALYVDYVI